MPPATSHVAFFLPELRAGGAQRVIITLSKAFIERGIRVDIVVARKEGAFLADVPEGVNLVDLRARFMCLGAVGLALSAMTGLVRYLRDYRPNAMLSTLTGANLVAVLARRLSGVPVRLVLREAVTLQNLPNSFYKLLMKKLYRHADAVISLTQYMRSELVDVLGLPESLVQCVPNPVDTRTISEGAAAPCPHSWMEPGRPPVIVTAGRLIEQKDLATLIHAFAVLVRRIDVRLVILGEGPQRANLEQLVDDLKLEKYVLMPGFEPNPYCWVVRSRVFVLSSRWEGQPNSLIEAIDLGVPVVCTRYDPSVEELVGGFGEVVPVGDAEAMAAALVRLVESTAVGRRSVSADRTVSAELYASLLLTEDFACD